MIFWNNQVASIRFTRSTLYIILGILILIKILISASVWHIPFSWDNWRYIATAHSIYTGNFEELILSGKPYKSFFAYPVGLPAFLAILRPITPSFYDSGKLLALLSSLFMTYTIFKICFNNQKTPRLIEILIFIFIVTFPGMSWMSHAIYPESLLIPLLIYGLYRLMFFKLGRKELIGMGILTGISYLVKPEGALLGILCIIALSYDSKDLKSFIKGGILLGVPFIIIILPYTLALYLRYNTFLLPLTNYHLEIYTTQAGNTLLKFIRNFLDNIVFIWSKQYSWIHIGLIPLITFGIFKVKFSKNIILILSFLAIVLILHSRAFGIHYFQQLNPTEALARYSLIYVPISLILFFELYKSLKISSNTLSIIGLYLLVLISFSIRNTIPVAYYYPKGWINKEIAESIQSHEHLLTRKPLLSTPAVFSYLEYENGFNANLQQTDSTQIVSPYDLLKKDSLYIRDPLGRIFNHSIKNDL